MHFKLCGLEAISKLGDEGMETARLLIDDTFYDLDYICSGPDFFTFFLRLNNSRVIAALIASLLHYINTTKGILDQMINKRI